MADRAASAWSSRAMGRDQRVLAATWARRRRCSGLKPPPPAGCRGRPLSCAASSFGSAVAAGPARPRCRIRRPVSRNQGSLCGQGRRCRFAWPSCRGRRAKGKKVSGSSGAQRPRRCQSPRGGRTRAGIVTESRWADTLSALLPLGMWDRSVVRGTGERVPGLAWPPPPSWGGSQNQTSVDLVLINLTDVGESRQPCSQGAAACAGSRYLQPSRRPSLPSCREAPAPQ
jgi:hypothetical protein